MSFFLIFANLQSSPQNNHSPVNVYSPIFHSADHTQILQEDKALVSIVY